MIKAFQGEYRWLSNFWPALVVDENGIEYATIEHAYQAAKSLDLAVRREVAALPKPGDTKRFGRRIVVRSDWNDVKANIMEDFVRQKFAIPELRAKLIATGDEELAEGNTWHDNYWGSCTCPRCENITGENTLGKILMKIREEING